MFTLLNGIKVLDLTTIVLGPYATQFLGDFGADVIKIENIDGDLFRSVRPGRSATMGAGYLNCNRNKRSIALDLKSPQGKEILNKLVKNADVIVHNMRSSTAKRLAIDYASMRAINDKIVYCFAPGYGQHGKYAAKPAYDDIIQAESGIAQLNKGPDGQPRFIPTIICDKVGGMHLAMSVLAGLVQREKHGQGCCIEAPMFEGMVSFLMTEQLGGESFVPPLGGTGYERLNSPYRKPFPTADGYISILPYNTRHWQAFFRLVEHHDMLEHPFVVDPVQRSQNVGSLYKIVSECTPAMTTAEWARALTEIDVPFAPVNDIASLLNDPHLNSVNYFTEYQHPTEGTLRKPGSPFYVHSSPASEDIAPPALGYDSLAILHELGYQPDDIAALQSAAVVFAYQQPASH